MKNLAIISLNVKFLSTNVLDMSDEDKYFAIQAINTCYANLETLVTIRNFEIPVKPVTVYQTLAIAIKQLDIIKDCYFAKDTEIQEIIMKLMDDIFEISKDITSQILAHKEVVEW